MLVFISIKLTGIEKYDNKFDKTNFLNNKDKVSDNNNYCRNKQDNFLTISNKWERN